MPTYGTKKRMIYGLEKPKDDWFRSQLDAIVDAGDRHIDGLSLEFRGLDQNGELVIEIHGFLNPTQLRLIANAMENTPTKGDQR